MQGHTSSRLAVTILLALLCVAAMVEAKTYVTFSGGFYFTYPDDWQQVSYNTVDEYLAKSKAGRPLYNYDAAFAPAASDPFFSNQYLIVFVDTVGQLTDTQIDSVLGKWSATFGNGIKYFPVGDFLADVKSNEPIYDKDRKLFTVVNDIVANSQTIKKNLIMMKFYEKGIASFYFYAPQATFDSNKVVFQQMMDSFGSGDIQQALPKDSVKVADIKTDKSGRPTEPESKVRKVLPYGTAFILILIIIIARKRRKKDK